MKTLKKRHFGLIHTQGSIRPSVYKGGKYKAREKMRRNGKAEARKAMKGEW